MAQSITCDRCQGPCSWSDERAYELFRQEYPTLAGQDICPTCYGHMDLASVVAGLATAKGVSQADYLRQWASLYEPIL